MVQMGNLAKNIIARRVLYKRRDALAKPPGPQAVPATFNYDLWWRSSADVSPRRNSKERSRCIMNGHLVSGNIGNGDVGTRASINGVGPVFLGESGLPEHTFSIGGRLGLFEDDGENAHRRYRSQLQDRPLFLKCAACLMPARPSTLIHRR